ncbi:hypothetical protein [Sphingomonas aracearum]|uniref:hypothetical protein n=1 Tax=Sphingomonas aracearum TaxID=2283317 RepID=UPI0011C034ED|nr:hypothetical protein [Sphingomonas aracearum]
MAKVKVIGSGSGADWPAGAMIVWDLEYIPGEGQTVTDGKGRSWNVVQVTEEQDGFLETTATIIVIAA